MSKNTYYDGELLGRPQCQQCSERFAADLSRCAVKCSHCGTVYGVTRVESSVFPPFRLLPTTSMPNFSISVEKEQKRINFEKDHPDLVAVFKEGDWVFGTGKHVGCSEVFWGAGLFQPFDYLGDYDPKNFRLATDEEKLKAGWSPK